MSQSNVEIALAGRPAKAHPAMLDLASYANLATPNTGLYRPGFNCKMHAFFFLVVSPR